MTIRAIFRTYIAEMEGLLVMAGNFVPTWQEWIGGLDWWGADNLIAEAVDIIVNK